MINPFATQYVKPGMIEFVFQTTSLSCVIDSWLQAGFCGQIVGPHGSGKSTLLHAIARVLQTNGCDVRYVQVCKSARPCKGVIVRDVEVKSDHQPESMLSLDVEQLGSVCWPARVNVIDGFEQLDWASRTGLRLYTRRKGHGLLVTTHAPKSWPATVHSTQPSVNLFRSLCRGLLDQVDMGDQLIDEAMVESAFSRSSGNIREAFFYLYDRYQEEHRRCNTGLQPGQNI